MTMETGGEAASLAPVIPLFGTSGTTIASVSEERPRWRSTWHDDRAAEAELSAIETDPRMADGETAPAEIDPESVERLLTKRLRTRSLSVSEARSMVARHGLDAASAQSIIDRFQLLGYLDDAALASQLVRAGVERRAQGRQVIAQAMAKRGIPREVADAALAELPDDDADRALEFARAKARSMTSLDRDTAIRRLSGQLARRGYRGSTVLAAAKQALDELGGSPSGVRFR